MTSPVGPTAPGRGLPRGQLLFVSALLLVGAGFLALSAYRALRPEPPPARGPDLAEGARADLEQRGFRPLSGPLARLLAGTDAESFPTQAHPLLGRAAPGFELEDSDAKPWRLDDRGPVVLVFYLGYSCPHCVSQLFALSKDAEKFAELGARVVAVSADPPALTRKRFERYGKFAFPVLSDPGNRVAQQYGCYRPKTDKSDEDQRHGTFVIARQGKVVWANTGEEPFTEDRTLLIELARAEGRLPKR
jgi:peroxiredoxin